MSSLGIYLSLDLAGGKRSDNMKITDWIMKKENVENLTSFLFEASALKRVLRAGQQALFEIDAGDNVASHSFLTALVALFLAERLEADSGRVVKMAILHDLDEARTGDRNWINRRYIDLSEEAVRKEQVRGLPSFSKMEALSTEYEKRETLEAKIVKDADYLAQIISLKERAAGGNKEAERWLENSKEYTPRKSLQTEAAGELAEEIIGHNPARWWENLAFK